MKIIDSHIHMFARTTDDYENMNKAGYVAVVEPAFWAGTDRTCAGSYYDYFNHLLGFEHDRAKKYGLYHYSLLGVNAKEARHTKIAFEVIENLEKYLDHPFCLGVGEIGLDLITPDEEEVLRRQVQIAEKNKLPVIIHSPHINKRVGVEHIIKILDEENVDFKRYILDHNTEETIGITLEIPEILAGITLYPTKVSNQRAAEIIKKCGPDRILINSSADWGKSYPLNVSQAVEQFPQFGVSKGAIRKVAYDNAIKFFSQSPKFKVDD